MGRIRQLIGSFVRWYTTRTGMVYGLLLVVTLVLVLIGRNGAAIAVLAILITGMLLPLRLQSLSGQVATIKRKQTRSQQGGLPDGWLESERRVLLEEIETVRAEIRSLLRSERTSWRGAVSSLEASVHDLRGLPANDRLPDGTTYQNRLGDVSLRLARMRPRIDSDHVIVVVGPDVTETAWLFEALLVRGDIAVQPTADVHKVLELRGRRIPSSSQSSSGSTADIEIAPGVGAVVGFRGAADRDSRAVVEFIDPASFRYDAERFSNRLPLLLDSYERVSLVLVAARPQITVGGPGMPRGEARPLVVQLPELECLTELARQVPSSVVDAERLSDNPRAILSNLFERLFPDEDLEHRRLNSVKAAAVIPSPEAPMSVYRTPMDVERQVARMRITPEEEEWYDRALTLHAELTAR